MSNPVIPKEVYDSYPVSDLLGIDPPEVGESFHDYINRQSKNAIRQCGDTLFAFLIFEMSDAGDREEAVHMIDTAIRDLTAVRDHLARRTDNG
jgi:hypothetical protein